MTPQEALAIYNQGINKLVEMRDEIMYVKTYWARLDAQGKAEVKAKINTNIAEAKTLVDQFNSFVQTL